MSTVTALVPRAPLRPSATTATGAVAAAASAAVTVRLGLSWWTIVVAVAVWTLVWIAAIDLESRLLPDRIVLPVMAAVLVACSLIQPGHALEHGLAALAAGGFFFVAAVVRPGDLGMGDAKLALLLGALLGSAVLSALMLGFVVFAAVGLVLVAREGRSALKRQLPLGPFLALGAIATLLLAGGHSYAVHPAPEPPPAMAASATPVG
jgi:prepilin signal peptidase PulO-like enzyme (type II secretory pathway)